MKSKFKKIFKKKEITKNLSQENFYLTDLWNQTSTFFDFENFISTGRSKYFQKKFGNISDPVAEIFHEIDFKIKLGFKVSNYNELSIEYKGLNDNKIIKKIFTEEKYINEQLQLSEMLISTISQITINNGLDQEYFESYINLINDILRPNGLSYSIETQQIISMNNEWEKENISSLFPLLDGYGQTNEFMKKSINEYHDGDYDNCVINTGKAVETFMKCICEKNNYSIDLDKATFAKLLEVLNSNNFFKREEYIQGALINNLVEGLKTGLPKHRNESAHGASLEGKKSNKYVAKLTIDLMVSYLHYFVSLDKKL